MIVSSSFLPSSFPILALRCCSGRDRTYTTMVIELKKSKNHLSWVSEKADATCLLWENKPIITIQFVKIKNKTSSGEVNCLHRILRQKSYPGLSILLEIPTSQRCAERTHSNTREVGSALFPRWSFGIPNGPSSSPHQRCGWHPKLSSCTDSCSSLWRKRTVSGIALQSLQTPTS